ncbi:hypothetical protein SYN65AY6LI_01100 [Synechococcus sp. 65AY6Li]|nr:hypothetical protein SYN65AY6LI_01100 [Synechococcus sp. 65AY6Li]
MDITLWQARPIRLNDRLHQDGAAIRFLTVKNMPIGARGFGRLIGKTMHNSLVQSVSITELSLHQKLSLV